MAAAPRGAVAAIPPSYAFEPETDGLGIAVDPAYRRQLVAYRGRHQPGTIVIDTPKRVPLPRAARRHGDPLRDRGRAARLHLGRHQDRAMKREWPDWRPPAEMLRRRPDLPRYMEGGPDNPLGARALYLGSSLYRIHGTNEPHTIGRSVSSGCIRMLNEDVVDLYKRGPGRHAGGGDLRTGPPGRAGPDRSGPVAAIAAAPSPPKSRHRPRDSRRHPGRARP